MCSLLGSFSCQVLKVGKLFSGDVKEKETHNILRALIRYQKFARKLKVVDMDTTPRLLWDKNVKDMEM